VSHVSEPNCDGVGSNGHARCGRLLQSVAACSSVLQYVAISHVMHSRLASFESCLCVCVVVRVMSSYVWCVLSHVFIYVVCFESGFCLCCVCWVMSSYV